MAFLKSISNHGNAGYRWFYVAVFGALSISLQGQESERIWTPTEMDPRSAGPHVASSVAKWIETLDDDRYSNRRQAFEFLDRLVQNDGQREPLRIQLKQHAHCKSMEKRLAIARLLKRIEQWPPLERWKEFVTVAGASEASRECFEQIWHRFYGRFLQVENHRRAKGPFTPLLSLDQFDCSDPITLVAVLYQDLRWVTQHHESDFSLIDLNPVGKSISRSPNNRLNSQTDQTLYRRQLLQRMTRSHFRSPAIHSDPKHGDRLEKIKRQFVMAWVNDFGISLDTRMSMLAFAKHDLPYPCFQLARKTLATKTSSGALTKAVALMVVAKITADQSNDSKNGILSPNRIPKDALDEVWSEVWRLIDDDRIVATWQSREAGDLPIRTRMSDVARVAILLRSGEDPRPMGVLFAEADQTQGYSIHTLGFQSPQDRWDFEAKFTNWMQNRKDPLPQTRF